MMRVSNAAELGILLIMLMIVFQLSVSATLKTDASIESTSLDDKNSTKIHGNVIEKFDEQYVDELLVSNIVSIQYDKVKEKEVYFYIDEKLVETFKVRTGDKLDEVVAKIKQKIAEYSGGNPLLVECETTVGMGSCHVDIFIK